MGETKKEPVARTKPKPANDEGRLTHHDYNDKDHVSNVNAAGIASASVGAGAGAGAGTVAVGGTVADAVAVAVTDVAGLDGEMSSSTSKTNSPKTQPPPPPSALGHEGFVQPSSYLRPRAKSRPMTPAAASAAQQQQQQHHQQSLPLSAVDRDQKYGLVSPDCQCPSLSLFLSHSLLILIVVFDFFFSVSVFIVVQTVSRM